MTRRRILLVLVTVLVAAIVVVTLALRGPSYGGRDLGEWLDLVVENPDQNGVPGREAAVDAVLLNPECGGGYPSEEEIARQYIFQGSRA